MASESQVLPQTPTDLETIRRRARQAVEYYQRQVAPSHSSTKSSGSTISSASHGGKSYDSTRVSTEEALQSGVAPASSSSFYRAKMKAGIIDMRSSYNERIGMNRSRSRTFHGPHSGRARTQNYAIENKVAEKKSQMEKKTGNSRGSGHGIYRSNSNLEMDSIELIEDDLPSPGGLHREYGSTSSLDLLGTSGGENFFAMLKDFRNQNLDQRSPAPPRLQELLRGRIDGKSGGKVTNGSAMFDKENEDLTDSPKTKSKSKHKDRKARAKSITGETSAGILKKLRGNKPEADITSKSDEKLDDSGSEERYRHKAFVHFDCQSVGVNLNEVIKKRSLSGVVRNTATGASAASVNRNSYAGDKDDPDIIAGTDDGDGKSNDLVLSCPFFRNELGGEEERMVSLTKLTAHKRVQAMGNLHSAISFYRHPRCCGVSILDSSATPSGQVLPPLVSHKGHVVEYVDHGAEYYRHFFYGQEHQNFFGNDENLGPVAISIKREKVVPEERENNLGKADYGFHQFRIICRTSELTTLRGAILEEAIPSSSRLSSSRGVPVKEVLEFALSEIQLSCLRQTIPGQKTADQLMKLDEQGISKTYKVGIMYCRAGQSTEEEMYNNESGSRAFEEFLDLIGQKVRLKSFEGYRGGLDCKTDTTGTHSYYTKFDKCEVMFHVSTMLPFTSNNKQQLLRKRHIGNDIVTIVFQEPGAQPFTSKTIRSQFQHVFVIVRVTNPNTENVRYSIAVTRSKDVPPFGPPLHKHNSFQKSPEFVDFLMAKVINAENAAHRSEKFRAMATRTRQEYLKDLATNFTTNSPLESGSKLSKFALGSGRKKEKSKQRVVPDLYAKGAVTWNVQVEDVGSASQVECLLAIAFDTIVLMEDGSKDVIFMIPCNTVIGWTTQSSSFRLYYSQGECVLLKPLSGEVDEMQEIIMRLTAVTSGCETVEMNLKRNGLGQLGFHIQSEGIVTDVEAYGFAWQAGLRKGSRLVEICKVATATLQHDQIVDLLRTSATVTVVVVPPMDNGAPRGDGKSSPRMVDHSGVSYDTTQRFTSHVYSDSTMSSGRSSDDGRSSHFSQSRNDGTESHGSRGGSFDGHLSSGDELHSRTSSRDSTDHSLSGSSNRPWNPRQNLPTQSPSQATYLTGTDSTVYGTTSQQPSSSGGAAQYGTTHRQRHHNVPTEYSYPVTGNISLELLKQSQNTKYLLSQGQDHKGGVALPPAPPDHPSSSTTNLSQISDGSSLSSGSSAQAAHRAYMDKLHAAARAGKEAAAQRKDPGTQHSGRNQKAIGHKKSHVDVSPLSSNNSSPRSSNRNLSGMSSEESLNSRLRPGVTGTSKLTRPQPSSNFQEELMRLINPDLYDTDSSHPSPHRHSRGVGYRRGGRLQRTMSDESLHSTKGTITAADDDVGGKDVIFTTASSSQRENLSKEQRLSPRVLTDTPGVSRPRSKTSIDDHSVPLLESTAGLDWTNLVDVATKAIEGDGHGTRTTKDLSSSTHSVKDDDQPPPRPPSPQERLTATPAASVPVWRSVVSSPHQRIQDLELKVQQLQLELEKERRENSNMEAEIQQLRADNVRLQEESQTAAAQLRRFTEWFFNTIDRQ